MRLIIHYICNDIINLCINRAIKYLFINTWCLGNTRPRSICLYKKLWKSSSQKLLAQLESYLTKIFTRWPSTETVKFIAMHKNHLSGSGLIFLIVVYLYKFLPPPPPPGPSPRFPLFISIQSSDNLIPLDWFQS